MRHGRMRTVLHRKGTLADPAQCNLIDACQTVTTRLDGEGGGEVVAALVRCAVHLCVKPVHAAPRLLIQRVVGMVGMIEARASGD